MDKAKGTEGTTSTCITSVPEGRAPVCHGGYTHGCHAGIGPARTCLEVVLRARENPYTICQTISEHLLKPGRVRGKHRLKPRRDAAARQSSTPQSSMAK
jgi:hypothetical protein